jgi:amino acid transporter
MTIFWFKKVGWIYKPTSIIGWIITVITIVLCIQVFFAVDSHSHSVSDTFYGVFPYIISYLVVAGWIASKTSKDNT